MTKMIKLSLAAAVAVSAFATTATAGSLENAIKDTTISGKFMVGYNYADNKLADTTSNTNEYDIDVTVTTKVNDVISATFGVEADHDLATSDVTTDAGKGNEIGITKLYFTAKTDVATVMVGKQKQPTPFLDDERGDGVVALIPAGPVTIAAGTFTGMNGQAGVTSDINALAVIGSAGPVNASLWFLDIPNVADAYSLNLTANAGPVALNFTHSDADYDVLLNKQDASLTKLVASMTVADVNLVAGYGMTNDNKNGRGFGVDLTTDDDAATNFRLDQLVLDDYNDADALLLGASMTFGATTVGAQYLMVDVGSDTDATELDLTVKYAMSKNFSITGLYSDAEIEAGSTKVYDEARMELSLNYKF